MRILLAGRAGQLGSALERSLAPLGTLAAFDRKGFDLLRPDDCRKAIDEIKPDIIVNAAAYTAVDRAETEREAAFAVNAEAVRLLAEEAKQRGALLVHFSTDYVFDGEKSDPYVETDATHPIGVYGASKLAGERSLVASGCRHFIFRTSWVYSAGGRNFVKAILAAAKERPELRVVNDQRGAPTSSGELARAVAEILSNPDLLKKPGGIYHMTAAGETTWHGFAREILAAAKLDVRLIPVSSAEYAAQFGAKARRPKNSLLDNSKLRAAFGVSLADWREAFRAVAGSIPRPIH